MIDQFNYCLSKIGLLWCKDRREKVRKKSGQEVHTNDYSHIQLYVSRSLLSFLLIVPGLTLWWSSPMFDEIVAFQSKKQQFAYRDKKQTHTNKKSNSTNYFLLRAFETRRPWESKYPQVHWCSQRHFPWHWKSSPWIRPDR